MRPDDIEGRLEQMARASLPPDLRQQVLNRAAFGEAPDWRDRVWFSRGWRLAAAAVVLLVWLADHWAVRPPGPTSVAPPVAENASNAEAASLAEPTGLSAAQVKRLLQRVEMVSVTAPELASDQRGDDDPNIP